MSGYLIKIKVGILSQDIYLSLQKDFQKLKIQKYMEYEKIKNLKGKIEYCLRNYPETRNSDITLTIKIWQTFYGISDFVSLKDLYNLPREDNVKRIRAKIQNDQKKFLPTILKVAKKRGILEDEWRVAMGYPTKESSGTLNPSWTPSSYKESSNSQSYLI